MTGDLFEEILNSLRTPGSMSQETRDSLILRGIISLYGEIEDLRKEIKEVKKILPLYKILVIMGGIALPLVLGLLFEIMTGKVKLVF